MYSCDQSCILSIITPVSHDPLEIILIFLIIISVESHFRSFAETVIDYHSKVIQNKKINVLIEDFIKMNAALVNIRDFFQECGCAYISNLN